ncbi:MAG: hypothetical protein ACFFD2_11730 [Promethearchaeota archaeon]
MSSFKDSFEKQYVRENLWIKEITSFIKKYKADRPKYLCMPGQKAIFARKLINSGIVLCEDIIACEIDKKIANDIVVALPRCKIIRGNIDHLLGLLSNYTTQKYPNQEIKTKEKLLSLFPFDIINLDYEGEAIPLDKNNLSYRVKVWQTIIENQYTTKPFLFLLNTLGQPNRGLKEEHTKIICDYIIKDIAINIKNNIIARMWKEVKSLDNKQLSYKHSRICLYAVPIKIIFLGFPRFKVSLLSTPYTYIGKTGGNKSRMICFAFLFDNYPEEFSSGVKKDKDKYNNLERAIKLIKNTIDVYSEEDDYVLGKYNIKTNSKWWITG